MFNLVFQHLAFFIQDTEVLIYCNKKHFIPSCSLLGFSLTRIVVLTFDFFFFFYAWNNLYANLMCSMGKQQHNFNTRLEHKKERSYETQQYYLWKNVLACLISIVSVPQPRCSNNEVPVSSGHKLGSRNDQQTNLQSSITSKDTVTRSAWQSSSMKEFPFGQLVNVD